LFFFFVADILPLAVNSKLKRNANNPKGKKIFNVGMNKRRLYKQQQVPFNPPFILLLSFWPFFYKYREKRRGWALAPAAEAFQEK
jgi:hypothetical protein